MRECRHDIGKRVTRRWVPTLAGSLTTGVIADVNVCTACGETFGLGPSNDHGEAVAVEMRAAELVADAYDPHTDAWRVRAMTVYESEGLGDLDQFPFLCDGNLAGHLARAIVDHENGGE